MRQEIEKHNKRIAALKRKGDKTDGVRCLNSNALFLNNFNLRALTTFALQCLTLEYSSLQNPYIRIWHQDS